MIPALVKELGNTFNKTAGTTIALTTTGATSAGNLIVARVVFDNFTTASKPVVSSITKMAGETANWVFLGAARSTSTSAGAFASGEMWAIQTTVAWSAAAYTVTLDSSVTQKAIAFTEFSGVTATLRNTAGTNYSTTTTAASASTTGTAPVANDLALGLIFGSNVAAAMAGDNDTTAGSWSAASGFGSTGGSGATNNFGISQHKVLTSGSHQTYANSAAMTAGNGSIVAILQPIPEPSITQAAYRFYADGAEGAAVFLVDQYGESNRSGGGSLYSGLQRIGQSFLGNGLPLARASFHLARPGTPDGTVTAALYAHSGTFGNTGIPTGAALATSSTVIAATSISSTSTWYDFDFDGSVTLDSGTPYVIVLITTLTTGPGSLEISYDTTTPTHAGNYAYYSGSAWTGSSAADLVFKVYGSSVPSVPLAAQDTAPTVDISSGDVNLQLRVRLQVTTNAGQPGDDYQLQWEKNASGTWISGAALDDGQSTGATVSTLGSGYAFLGQSFTATTSNIVTRASFLMARQNNPTGVVTAELYAHAGTYGSSSVGTGSPLATSTSITGSTLATSQSWVEFTFPGTYALQSGTRYVIGVRSSVTGDATNNYNLYDSNSAGHSGNEVTLSSPSTWGSLATYDLAFNVYTDPLYCRGFDSANLTNAAATTNRLTGGTGTFVAGEVSETGLVSDLAVTAGNYTELLYSLTLKQADLANGDTLRFRILRNGDTTGLTYTAMPTINVGVAAGGDKTGTASVTGAGSVGATAGVVFNGAGFATGVGSTTGRVTASGTATVAGLGATSASGSALTVVSDTAAAAGSGTTSAFARQVAPASAAGLGSTSAVALVVVPGTASAAGLGATDATGTLASMSQVTGLGASAALADVIVPGAALAVGAGSVSAVGGTAAFGVASVTGVGSTSASARSVAPASVLGAGSTGAAGRIASSSGAVGSGVVSALARLGATSVPVVGAGIVTANSSGGTAGSAAVVGVGVVGTSARMAAPAQVLGMGAVGANGSVRLLGAATVSGLGVVSAKATQPASSAVLAVGVVSAGILESTTATVLAVGTVSARAGLATRAFAPGSGYVVAAGAVVAVTGATASVAGVGLVVAVGVAERPYLRTAGSTRPVLVRTAGDWQPVELVSA